MFLPFNVTNPTSKGNQSTEQSKSGLGSKSSGIHDNAVASQTEETLHP